MIKDEDDKRETVLDMVATHIKTKCSMMDYKHRAYHTNTPKEIAEESAPDTLQQLLRKMSIGDQFLPSLLIGNIITSAIKNTLPHSKSRSGCTSTKRRRSSTCMTISSVVRMKSCCASRNPRQWLQISIDRRKPVQWKDMFKS